MEKIFGFVSPCGKRNRVGLHVFLAKSGKHDARDCGIIFFRYLRLNRLNILGEGWKQDRQIPSSWEFSEPIQPEVDGRIRVVH